MLSRTVKLGRNVVVRRDMRFVKSSISMKLAGGSVVALLLVSCCDSESTPEVKPWCNTVSQEPQKSLYNARVNKNETSVGERVVKAYDLIKKGKVEEAYAAFKAITDEYGVDRGYRLFSGRYGELWYMRGYTAMKLGNRAGKRGDLDKQNLLYAESASAFVTSHKLQGDPEKSINRYATQAILMLGNVEQKRGGFEKAIEHYTFFLNNYERRSAKGSFDKGMMRINLAICHFSMAEPGVDKGMEHFQTVFENKERLKVQDAAIVATFEAMASALIKEREEAKLVDFVRDHRATLMLEPYEMFDYVPSFLKLSSDALNAKMNKACVSLLTLIPETQLCDQDFESVLSAYQDLPGVKLGERIVFKEAVEDDHERLNKFKAKPKLPEHIKFKIMAYLHEVDGHVRGAFGVYEQLELYHEDSPDREENLYNLVRTANNIGEIFKTEEYGLIFLKAFPKSSHRETVERLMLQTLFFNGEYEKCIQVAEQIIADGVKGPSKRHDVTLHCLGGSYYYLGQAVKAAPLLEKHVKMYGKGTKDESEYLVASEYFNASNDTYINEYERAAVKLDKFLKTFPDPIDNPFLAHAKYDRASCHFATSESGPALKLLGEVIKEFPTCGVLDKAWALKGNVAQNEGNREAAETSYKEALKICQERRNSCVEQEVLYYLVDLLGAESHGNMPNSSIKDAVPYYDLFWKKFQHSPYKSQVAARGIPALRAANRGKEALGSLQAVIAEMALEKNAQSLEPAINTYSMEFLKEKGNTVEMLIARFRNIHGKVDNADASALMSLSVIRSLDQLIEDAEGAPDAPAKIKRYRLLLKGEYKFLEQLGIEELSNSMCFWVAALLENAAPKEGCAERYYMKVIQNVNAGKGVLEQKLRALDAMNGRSVKSLRKDQFAAFRALEELYKGKKQSDISREKVLVHLVDIAYQLGNNDKLILYGEAFLADKKQQFRKDEVCHHLGMVYLARGEKMKARSLLTQAVDLSPGKVKYSAPACKLVMELTWERNQRKNGKSDRQVAYEFGRSYYLSLAKVMQEKADLIPADEKAAYEAVGALYKKYEVSGFVKKVPEKVR